MLPEIDQIYGNRVRLRVCGLLVRDDRLLLVNHSGLAPGACWLPPGGGVEFGESLQTCLEREFFEETGLRVATGEFCFVCEFIKHPLHAVELFFRVTAIGGNLTTGSDPEMESGKQLIQSVDFLSWQSIAALPRDARHNVFNCVESPELVLGLSGLVDLHAGWQR